jgi:hypothetical protein
MAMFACVIGSGSLAAAELKTVAGLIADGYELKSLTIGTFGGVWLWLQKGTTAYLCIPVEELNIDPKNSTLLTGSIARSPCVQIPNNATVAQGAREQQPAPHVGKSPAIVSCDPPACHKQFILSIENAGSGLRKVHTRVESYCIAENGCTPNPPKFLEYIVRCATPGGYIAFVGDAYNGRRWPEPKPEDSRVGFDKLWMTVCSQTGR